MVTLAPLAQVRGRRGNGEGEPGGEQRTERRPGEVGGEQAVGDANRGQTARGEAGGDRYRIGPPVENQRDDRNAEQAEQDVPAVVNG